MKRINSDDNEILDRIIKNERFELEGLDPNLLDEMESSEEYRSILRKHGKDILSSQKYLRLKSFIQHGNVTVYEHCIHVALCAIRINEKLRIKGKRRELVRGALLHDYFLYDWHNADAPGNTHPKLHGFYHPGIALRNATRDFSLSEREKDIIKKHMWPLTVKIPMCREAWVVCMADKYASTLETLRIRKGKIRVDYA